MLFYLQAGSVKRECGPRIDFGSEVFLKINNFFVIFTIKRWLWKNVYITTKNQHFQFTVVVEIQPVRLSFFMELKHLINLPQNDFPFPLSSPLPQNLLESPLSSLRALFTLPSPSVTTHHSFPSLLINKVFC